MNPSKIIKAANKPVVSQYSIVRAIALCSPQWMT
jgi:hypothetical protein